MLSIYFLLISTKEIICHAGMRTDRDLVMCGSTVVLLWGILDWYPSFSKLTLIPCLFWSPKCHWDNKMSRQDEEKGRFCKIWHRKFCLCRTFDKPFLFPYFFSNSLFLKVFLKFHCHLIQTTWTESTSNWQKCK